MPTILFPENIPSKQKLKRLLATRRQVTIDNKTNLVCVAVNGRTMLTLPLQHYLIHIQHFLWREDAIRLVLHYSAQLNVSEELSDNLKMCLWYMDLVMEGMISESGPTVTDKSTFRSEVFDWYLVLEYWVRRHEPLKVREFRRNSDRNLNHSSTNECGECSGITILRSGAEFK